MSFAAESFKNTQCIEAYTSKQKTNEPDLNRKSAFFFKQNQNTKD